MKLKRDMRPIELVASILERMANMKTAHPERYQFTVGYRQDQLNLEAACRKLISDDYGYMRSGEIAGDYRDAGREPFLPRIKVPLLPKEVKP